MKPPPMSLRKAAKFSGTSEYEERYREWPIEQRCAPSPRPLAPPTRFEGTTTAGEAQRRH